MESDRHILVVSHTGREDSLEAAVQVCRKLEASGVAPVLSPDECRDLRAYAPELEGLEVLGDDVLPHDLELVIVLGGDGTILRAAEIVRDADVPILGINLGHVGFLAESERDDLTRAVTRALVGDYQVEERMTLLVRVKYDGEVTHEDWALNDVSVEKASRERMIEVMVEVDRRPLTSFGCDGVVMSTPTGSTAYAFSAGGPIVWPTLDALLFTPISAHALFTKPLVVTPDSAIAVEILDRVQSGAIMWCDGRRSIELKPGARVVVTRSPVPVKMARLHAARFTDRLVRKFNLPVVGWRGPA
ncbi:MAG TPA: NAD kinase [Gryllotalpicola sp.]